MRARPSGPALRGLASHRWVILSVGHRQGFEPRECSGGALQSEFPSWTPWLDGDPEDAPRRPRGSDECLVKGFEPRVPLVLAARSTATAGVIVSSSSMVLGFLFIVQCRVILSPSPCDVTQRGLLVLNILNWRSCTFLVL